MRAVLSPCHIASIPTEVLLIILRYSVAGPWQASEAHKLRSVCRWWDEALTNCPWFWTTLRGSQIPHSKALQRALKYSRDGPLDIEICDWSILELTRDQLRRIMRPELLAQQYRWRSLEVVVERTSALDAMAAALRRPAPALERANIRNKYSSSCRSEPLDLFGGRAPLLRDLTLEGFILPPESSLISGLRSLTLYLNQFSESSDASNLLLSNLSKVLLDCHQLRELSLHYLGRYPSDHLDVPMLQLRNLEKLHVRIGTPYPLSWQTENLAHNSLLPLLRRTLVPACRSLHIDTPIRALAESEAIEQLVASVIRNRLEEQDCALLIILVAFEAKIELTSTSEEKAIELRLQGRDGYKIEDTLFHILAHLHSEFEIRWPVTIDLCFPTSGELLSVLSFLDSKISTRRGPSTSAEAPLNTLIKLDVMLSERPQWANYKAALKKYLRRSARFALWSFKEEKNHLIIKQSNQLVVWRPSGAIMTSFADMHK